MPKLFAIQIGPSKLESTPKQPFKTYDSRHFFRFSFRRLHDTEEDIARQAVSIHLDKARAL